MRAQHIGINLGYIHDDKPFLQLEKRLAEIQQMGIELVELDIAPFHLIVHGEIHRPSLAEFLAITRQFDLRYSVHGLMRLNLAYDSRHELCCQIMRSQIEICRALQACCLVYHSGLQAMDEARYEVRRTLLTTAELAEGARREVVAFRTLATRLADANLIVGMENGDTHQWEHALIARFGLPRAALLQHHARIHIAPIVRQLEAIGSPHVGLTVDVGHLHIAAHDMGFDYFEAVEQATPWVKHIHLSDNLGLLDRGFGIERDRWAFGEADIHMPPGWGCVPYRQVFDRWPDFQGHMIMELETAFHGYGRQARETLQTILSEP